MASTSFDSGKRQADSLYNNMQFREAYEVYHGLLDNYEVKKDSEKKLMVLNDLCDVCDVLSRRTELMSYLQQMLDLSIATGNDYFHSLALSMLGKRLFYEGDKVRGFDYLEQAVNLMEKTNRYDKDHLLHSQLNVLSTLYHKDLNYEKALETDQRNVKVTFEGNNWGTYSQIQQQDQRVALAKLAKTLITILWGARKRPTKHISNGKRLKSTASTCATTSSLITSAHAANSKKPLTSTKASLGKSRLTAIPWAT